ncbi:hypothetical protein [Paenibacillus sp. J2TS4]|uniref:hypothetical protein n=1 Tax=Paenibacillus sp. J2TS4 TaxID=2807194 RepID=UPI001B25A658|nr:hypothetical protein [Paenibacillus sp. J2TS4]GIP34178.1 hypothetical protein J2TS4_33880 [Paenibacillus sp. J2TS4]
MNPIKAKWSKLALATSLSFALLLSSPGLPAYGQQASQEQTVPNAASGQQENYSLFLQDKYKVVVGDSLTKGGFIQLVAQVLNYAPSEEATAPSFADLDKSNPYYPASAALYEQGILTASEVNADRPLDVFQAVFIAVKAAGLKELAYTYPQEKTDKTLAKLNLAPDVYLSKEAAQELAVAIDTGLVSPAFYEALRTNSAASKVFAEELLGKILAYRGQYKQYLGEVNDPDIYSKLIQAYNTSDIIEAPELQQIVNSALENGLVTGYNLKDSRFDSNFIDSLSLTYGHSNIEHALQLIGLLRSEGLNAKVQLEPKTSAFIHLAEWGEPTESDTNRLTQIDNGNYIFSAKEYDLSFEFNTVDDKNRFQPIVLQYAKKDSEDQAGLILGSWWQPLYYSLTEIADYEIIANNKIVGGPYYAQSFSLENDSQQIADGFRKLDPDLDILTYTFWVDKPFHNYLTGDDFK